MVRVQLVLRVVQSVLYSTFPVPIGKIRMVFKIIHSTVGSFFFTRYDFLTCNKLKVGPVMQLIE